MHGIEGMYSMLVYGDWYYVTCVKHKACGPSFISFGPHELRKKKKAETATSTLLLNIFTLCRMTSACRLTSQSASAETWVKLNTCVLHSMQVTLANKNNSEACPVLPWWWCNQKLISVDIRK